MKTCERYFAERLFWLEDTNTLLHVVFVSGYGWIALHEGSDHTNYFPMVVGDTYTEAMAVFMRRPYTMLLEELL